MYNIFALKDYKFPENFLWGAGYAAHQVEGNNIHSQNWHVEQTENWPEKSGLACNSYEMYREDIALCEKLGMQAFRTSVEWSRIEPEEGVFNKEALDHYISFFSELKEKGIKVFATTVHFTMPYWFVKCGGVNNPDNLKYFERYLEYVVPKIAPYVDYWNVFNEFNLGYSPERVDTKLNSTIFHARGYHIIKKYSSAPVSTAHALIYYQPYRAADRWDKAMSEYCDLCDNEFFFHAIRTGEILYPGRDGKYVEEVKDTADFWSVNTYVRRITDARRADFTGKKYDVNHVRMIDKDFYLEEFNPECVIANLSRLTDKPVIITENGCCCDDDRFRIMWISLYLSALAEAIKMGIDVQGYLYWSLIDNYEWSSFLPRFGICDCDFKTFERTPKPSAYFYKGIIENNGFTQDILRKHLTDLSNLKTY